MITIRHIHQRKQGCISGYKENKRTIVVEPLGSYQKDLQKFMDAKVAKGVQYKSNADAFEDFKQYYDKKLKIAGAAGKKMVFVPFQQKCLEMVLICGCEVKEIGVTYV